ncbi:RagB/SusD family nutrient uptake outer membrane protein [Paradesertivirga mongoliensis]|nr:RagB/SusD family nutrient uptake outer membrane protein [Pedobacter mongoliensis]
MMLLLLGMSTFSCQKTFDLLPEDALDYSQAYQNVFDADAAVLGLYGKVTRIADKYLVLNELRADLEDVTPQADNYLREINDHNVSASNPWANPRPYYEIIINCNDVMHNFDLMLANKRLLQADYNIRYSEVAALRTWLYLQLGIHYGTVPYITDPLQSIEAAKDESKYPKLSFDELLTKLIDVMQGLPTLTRIPAGTSLLLPIDGYAPAKIFINKEQLMGDLYLWKGNYPQASHYYKKLFNYNGGDPVQNNDAYAALTLGSNGSDLSTAGSSWNKIFTQGFGERVQNNEIINQIPFDRNFAPVNPFIKLYAPNSYLIKPSDKAIQNWRNQTRTDGSPSDNARGEGVSYTRVGTNTYIKKIIPNYNPVNQFETTGKWIISRGGDLTLKFAESANRDGRDSLAYAFVNSRIRDVYARVVAPSVVNKTNEMQSFDSNPDYYFDARFGDSPNYRRLWSYQLGVRLRANLAETKVDSSQFFDMSVPGVKSYINYHKPFLPGKEAAFRTAMEDIMIAEWALESAFEGHRWPTLIRHALRREKETPGSGRAFLRDVIADKFIAAGKPVPAGVNALGTDVKNWYLPFNF